MNIEYLKVKTSLNFKRLKLKTIIEERSIDLKADSLIDQQAKSHYKKINKYKGWSSSPKVDHLGISSSSNVNYSRRNQQI